MRPNTLPSRMAICSCGRTAPSSQSLFGFRDRGPASTEATDTCVCGFFRCAHARQPGNVDPRSVVEKGTCRGFAPRGPSASDTYYCGCRGWE